MLLQSSPRTPPGVGACETVERVELASPTGGREICVSPGLATNLRFDAPAFVELQDEVRFEQVVRDRRLLTLMPPPDMAEGERLRLTVHFEGEPSPSGISLMLVGHSGQATHQVEVSRDERTRESLRRELLQERARTAQLREALARAAARLHQSGGLRGLILSGALGSNAIQFHEFYQGSKGYTEGELTVTRGASYRSDKTVALEVWLENSGTTPWTVAGAALSVNGVPMEGLSWEATTIPPGQRDRVVVEVPAIRGEPQGNVTLRLWEEGPRTIDIPDVIFP
ncbi:MAG TPA: DUF2381 family protein [Archangium sp.]|uniref:DUF2381 family protein n=1 Tax=Archangium sp. TaxID=1872627 RepID=UPI002E31C914|nr:DUF2381 family protein [Archangium sp.]HEX5753881.1 DUF2381 family protein [Archangium sp.]